MAPDIIILAAGKGTRMYSDLPKVLHPLGGKPMLAHVVATAQSLSPARTIIVGGHGFEQVRTAMTSADALTWVEQREQLGTGHAVLQTLAHLNPEGSSIILYGDVPLISAPKLRDMADALQHHDLVVLTADMPDPSGLGRIVRDDNQRLCAIVEEKDATADQRDIREINSGIMAVRNAFLLQACPKLGNSNQQQEYYLTDLVAMAVAEGRPVTTVTTNNLHEIQGVNDRRQLAILERSYQFQRASGLAAYGTTVSDPARLDIRGDLTVGRDVCLDVNVILSGTVHIGNNVTIGANCVIRDSSIGDGCVISDFSHLDGVRIAENCTVGPFARLRPGTEMMPHAKVGNFVETKKSLIGRGSKINHLSYVGDTTMGDEVNVGAGTITCNYDGVNKHRTTLGDRVFIGSNSSLVAPLAIGDDSTIGAGSVINRDVGGSELVVARTRQKHIAGWKRPEKKPKGSEE